MLRKFIEKNATECENKTAVEHVISDQSFLIQKANEASEFLRKHGMIEAAIILESRKKEMEKFIEKLKNGEYNDLNNLK